MDTTMIGEGFAAGSIGQARDFLRASAEAGSSIVHSSGSTQRLLRRVVHLVDTRQTANFPRAVASEHGKPNPGDLLRRGDAVLYALGCDRFRPGDTVAWQGQTWAVVGTLGQEVVGDEPIYEEVGLRRLAVSVMARVQGIIGGG